jgi:hypothetical protein
VADFRYPQIVGGLEMQPRTRVTAEISCRSRTTSAIIGAGTLSAFANASALMPSGFKKMFQKHVVPVDRPHSILKHLRYRQ